MVVTTAGSPTGMAAVANATAAWDTAMNVLPWARFSPIDATSATPAISKICLDSRSSWRVSGVLTAACSGHQLLDGNLCQLSVPRHPGLDDHHRLQRGDSRRLTLLLQAHDRVEQRQQDACFKFLEPVEAADTGREQHNLHRIAVLTEEGVPAGLCHRQA